MSARFRPVAETCAYVALVQVNANATAMEPVPALAGAATAVLLVLLLAAGSWWLMRRRWVVEAGDQSPAT